MRANTILTYCLFVVCCLPFFVYSQTADNKVLTGISATFVDYKGIVNKQFFNPRNFNPGVRINANMYMNGWLNYTLAASFVPRASYPQVDGSFNPQLLIDVNTGLQLKANNGKIMNENAVVAPYIYSGLGYSTSEGKSGVYLPAAAGVRFRLGNNVSLNLESMYRVKFNSTIQPMSHTIGFNFILPSQKPPVETASRGKTTKPKPVITTKKQELPQDTVTEEVVTTEPTSTEPTSTEPVTTEPVTTEPVTTEPVATEVASTEPATEKQANDQDNDGVEDRFDACPDVAGPVEEGGCPPREKIAPATELPTEEVVAMFPDADGDGVEDRFDPCPNVPGKKEEGGCPERYKIGQVSEEISAKENAPTEVATTETTPTERVEPTVPNEIAGTSSVAEEAPSQTLTPSEEGSAPTETAVATPVIETPPQVEEVEQTLSADDMNRLKIIAMNISYKPGTDALMPGTESYIQELKDLLAKYPTYKLVIRGHYSAGREEDDNKVMSVKRAFQIKRQLILTKGMTPVRMSPDGFGSKETTAKNESRIEMSLEPLRK